ncbi:MAG: hypothetical protein HYZ53_22035 [Planctomycetes bacterium]|nr:hypothetical protein [Planctomycetota bacterium]
MKSTLHGVVHGKTIELKEDPGLQDGLEVEVLLQAAVEAPRPTYGDVFSLIASLSPGTRTQEDIDLQVREERDAWGER